MNSKEYALHFEHAMPYQIYFDGLIAEASGTSQNHNSQYLPINLQRSKRIAKTIKLSDEIIEALNNLHHKINWLVISENWCGDSAQVLPVINAIAEASKGKINLRIVYRDQNPDLMNAHLTNGSRSIPILIQLDANFAFINEWGPRPKEAQQLVKALKSNPETAPTYSEKLHKWYADDKTVSIQKELLKLLNIAIAFCPDCMIS